MRPPLLAQADELLQAGRGEDAVVLLERAGAAGDGHALAHLAVWRMMGRPTARDLPEARALLARAAALRHPQAAVMEVALTANGGGGAPDWPRAVALLHAAATYDRVAAGHLALLEAMALGGDGTPSELPEAEPLAPEGAVVRYPGFLSPIECEHVARCAADVMAPAVVVDPRSGRQVRRPHRTSDGGVIGPTRETLPVRAINARVAAISGTGIDQGESLTVLRYAPGQQYRPHSDALPGTRNQRIKTVLLYLTEGFAGGETTFPAHGVTVTPRIGDALLFTNTLADGRPDPRSVHAGLPVQRGVKWLATRWIRARPFSVWTGPDAPDPS